MPDLTIVIGSYLEAEYVQRIHAAQPGARIVYEPDLLPAPRYPCDHTARPGDVSAADRERWRTLIADADAYFDFDWLDPAGMPDNSPRLRWVQATSAGIGAVMHRNGLDRRCGDGGLLVTTAAGIHAQPLAEFALLGALHFAKGVPQLRQWQREKHWELYATRQLAGQRALVVGLGGIGRRVVALFDALGVEVRGMGRDGKDYDIPGLARLIGSGELGEALTATDILILACPLTEQTRGLIGRPQIARLPHGAVVVNIARGPVVDQSALTDALRDGRLGGACLDVFEEEPLPSGDPLWTLDNVIVSPHSASTVATENAALTDLFIDNLARFTDGRPLRNRYDPARGY